MRRLIAAGVLFSLVLATYFTGFILIRNTCNTADELLKSCITLYNDGKDAKSEAKKLEKYWTKKEKPLSIFADHNEIDEIELAISNLIIYSSSENKELFDEHSKTVKTLLHQLKEDIIPSIHSIL